MEGRKAWLMALLSATAGAVDVIGFQRLGLFTAHITGNLVVLAAEAVSGGPPRRLQILAIPVFMLAVAGTWRIARTLGRRGTAMVKPLLVVQGVLIGGVLLTSVIGRDDAKQAGAMAGVAAMLAVSAMACQFAMLHVALPGAPSTGVMTGNLTQIVLSALEVASSRRSNDGARVQLAAAGRSFVGFFFGCTTGALAVIWLERWAWSVPVAMAVLAALTAVER
jgi:uncharacterized membrane protein YoaK (UPF0700 family)